MGEKIRSLFVLGLFSMEMEYIESVLLSSGCDFMHAACNGSRCTPSTIDNCSIVDISKRARQIDAKSIVFIDCSMEEETSSFNCVLIKHKRSECDGFNSPENSWDASSVGQLMEYIFANSMHADVLMKKLFDAGYDSHKSEIVAASEHQLLDAYKGIVPFVKSDEVMSCRVEFISRVTGKTKNEISANIDMADSLIESADSIEMCGTVVADLRNTDLFLGMFEASAIMGRPFIASEKKDQTRIFFGSAYLSQVELFCGEASSKLGLTDIEMDASNYRASGVLHIPA